MRFVVFGEQNLTPRRQPGEVSANRAPKVQFLGKPARKNVDKRPPAPRRDRQVGFEHPGELDDRLVVKNHRVHVCDRDTGLPQTELNGVLGKLLVVLAPGEALLLSRGNDPAATYDRGRGVVVKGGNP